VLLKISRDPFDNEKKMSKHLETLSLVKRGLGQISPKLLTYCTDYAGNVSPSADSWSRCDCQLSQAKSFDLLQLDMWKKLEFQIEIGCMCSLKMSTLPRTCDPSFSTSALTAGL
jgi:hypothetical protein